MNASSACKCGGLGGCSDVHVTAGALPRQVAWLQGITLAWMTVECAISLWAAANAHSVALLAFGSDSLIELLSAVVVLLQFLPRFPLKKSHAEKSAAVLLFLLAGCVIIIAALAYGTPKHTSWLGMAITAAALVAMPVLARLKRRQARAIGNRALAADAAQSATCAYLAAVTLAGLAAYALWRVAWVDSLAALVAVPIIVVEGRRTWRGEGCGCCDWSHIYEPDSV
ncbi:MAG TPA: cation transporter [Terracidiphilus sp.]|nr:cation transporter [Terracidiphilus sp.]